MQIPTCCKVVISKSDFKKKSARVAHFKNANNKQMLLILRKEEDQNVIFFQSIFHFNIFFFQKT